MNENQKSKVLQKEKVVSRFELVDKSRDSVMHFLILL